MITLDDMAELARALVEAEKVTEKAEENLSKVKERERVLREETIPGAMQELGVEALTLDTGQKLTVKQDVYAAIPKDKKDEAFAWLEENNFGGLIKTEVAVQFGKGELEKAKELLEKLEAEDYAAGITQDVHAQTLKAFLREEIRKGTNIPLEKFGARPVSVAKITNK